MHGHALGVQHEKTLHNVVMLTISVVYNDHKTWSDQIPVAFNLHATASSVKTCWMCSHTPVASNLYATACSVKTCWMVGREALAQLT